MMKSIVGQYFQPPTTFVIKPTILGIYLVHNVMRTLLEVFTTGRRSIDLKQRGGVARLVEVKAD
jgi:hypothetical protein